MSSFTVTSSTSNQWVTAIGGKPDVVEWTGLMQDNCEFVLPIDQILTVPVRDWLPTAALAQTYPRWVPNSSQTSLVAGSLSLFAIYLNAGTTIGHISFISGGTAITFSGTGGSWWFALLDQNRNVLAQTADQGTAAWGTFSQKTLAIATVNSLPSLPASGSSAAATSITVPYTGMYYLGCMVYPGSTGTVNNLEGCSPGAGITGLSPTLYGTSDTGQTSLPAIPHQSTTLTALGVAAYAYVAS
jgi:hypothetical protein